MFISYFYKESDGVGSLRSRALYELLEDRNNELILVSRDSIKSKNMLIWLFFLSFKMLFSSYDKVYVTCGPFIQLPVVNLITLLKRKKFIVDFRDPWSLNIKTNYGKGVEENSSLKLYISKKIEKWTYKSCERFWVCTPGMYKEYSKLFNDDSKIDLVYNGHTINDSISKNKNEKKKFVCIGKFAEYDYQKANLCLEKIKNIGMEKVELYLIGSEININKKIIQENQMVENTYLMKRMPYKDAIKLASTCDIGICILRNEDFEFGTKVFDYIGLGLPIIDCFDHSASFYNFFKEYITDGEEDNLILNDNQRMRFYRKNIFLEHIEKIEK